MFTIFGLLFPLLLSFIVFPIHFFLFGCIVLWEYETLNYSKTIWFKNFLQLIFLFLQKEEVLWKIVKKKQYHVDDHSHGSSIDKKRNFLLNFYLFYALKLCWQHFSVIINNKNMTCIMLLFNGYKTFIIILVHNLYK